jgi:hypothetical protein
MKILSRKILLLFSLFAIKLIIAQTKFENGYFAGYSAGYCQDVVNCIPPNPPLPPNPQQNENSDSYKDGYNRGFSDALKVNKGQNDRERYKTSKYKSIDDFDDSDNSSNVNQMLLLALKKKQEIEKRVNKTFQETYDEIKNYNDKDSDSLKNIKIEYLKKIENLANNSSLILKKTDGDYKYLISLLQKIYDEFYVKVEEN